MKGDSIDAVIGVVDGHVYQQESRDAYDEYNDATKTKLEQNKICRNYKRIIHLECNYARHKLNTEEIIQHPTHQNV